MREIKFRAWHQNIGCMVGSGYTAKLEICENGVRIVDENGETYDASADVALMQYTGLKDKNGKEIYEGDVVKHRNNGGTWTAPVEVKWRNTAFELAMVPMRNTVFPRTEIEVIGNIYENPDLISTASSS